MRLLNAALITVDSLRADALEVVSSKEKSVSSNNLRRFAGSDAIRFTQAYSPTPFTWGTFASLFTSRYPAEVTAPSGVLLNAGPTLASTLQEAGWQTVGFNSNPFISVPFGYGRGFRSFDDGLLRSKARWIPTLFYPLLHKMQRLLQYHAYSPAQEMNRLAVQFLEGVEGSSPFFLWVHYMDPHGPYQRHDQMNYLSKLRAERLWGKVLEPGFVTTGEHQLLVETYRKEVGHALQHVGRLIDTLDELGLLEDTLIIFCGDHGDAFGEHGTYSHPRQLYDELIHVPLLFWCPDLSEREIDHPVGLLNVMPTILDILGFDLTAYEFRGHSLRRLMETGDTSYLPDYVVSDGKPERPETLASIRTAKWKLIIDEAKGGMELYDFKEDPGEKLNVVEQYPEVAHDLETKLQAELSRQWVGPREKPVRPEWSLAEEQEVLARLQALGYVDWVEEEGRQEKGQ